MRLLSIALIKKTVVVILSLPGDQPLFSLKIKKFLCRAEFLIFGESGFFLVMEAFSVDYWLLISSGCCKSYQK